jgi:hypothetical protein
MESLILIKLNHRVSFEEKINMFDYTIKGQEAKEKIKNQ